MSALDAGRMAMSAEFSWTPSLMPEYGEGLRVACCVPRVLRVVLALLAVLIYLLRAKL